VAEYIKTIVQQDLAISTTQWYTWDLPVHPITSLIFTIKAKVNSTGYPAISPWDVAALLDRLEIRFDGSAVNAISGQDLYMVNLWAYRRPPAYGQINDANDAELWLALRVPAGRNDFDPTECWPATARGALELAAYMKASDTVLDTVRVQIEAIQLPGATPSRHIRYSTIAPGAMVVGENDIDIPVGNILMGILIYSPTIISGTSDVNTVEQVQLLVDGLPRIFAKNNYEALMSDLATKIDLMNWVDKEQQRENTASTYTQNALTKGKVITDCPIWHYVLLDLDPTDDGTFFFDTSAINRLQLRIIAGDTGSPRIIPLEMISVERVRARGAT
jgi:hypothetical protein